MWGICAILVLCVEQPSPVASAPGDVISRSAASPPTRFGQLRYTCAERGGTGSAPLGAPLFACHKSALIPQPHWPTLYDSYNDMATANGVTPTRSPGPRSGRGPSSEPASMSSGPGGEATAAPGPT